MEQQQCNLTLTLQAFIVRINQKNKNRAFFSRMTAMNGIQSWRTRITSITVLLDAEFRNQYSAACIANYSSSTYCHISDARSRLTVTSARHPFPDTV
jgi:hypothetical protein